MRYMTMLLAVEYKIWLRVHLYSEMIRSLDEFNTIFFSVSVKCSIGATNALIPTFTAIQYPTAMRTLSVGIGNFAAGLALITVPYLWLLVRI